MNSKKLMVKPGKKVNLADHDPDDTHGLTKAMADRQLEKHRAKLDQLQELLYAGKLTEDKGIGLLLDAWTSAPQKPWRG